MRRWHHKRSFVHHLTPLIKAAFWHIHLALLFVFWPEDQYDGVFFSSVWPLFLARAMRLVGSTNTEKEGLKRSLKLMEENDISLECIISDRHPQVQKFLKEAQITQYYDVWHFEKGNIVKLSSFTSWINVFSIGKVKSELNAHLLFLKTNYKYLWIHYIYRNGQETQSFSKSRTAKR